MTRAAADLQNENERIIDIALKYGYDSPTAFNRAFQGVHGIAPSEARKSGAVLKAYLPISFKIIIKGEVEMDYRIEKKDEFRIVGAKEHYVLNVEENFAQIPAFWQKTVQSGTFSQILGLVNQEPKGILGLTSSMKGKDFDYYIAAPSDMVVPDGFVQSFFYFK
jgi:AraC family transcriptional regulator